MRENLHRFFRAARGAGVRLSPAESIDAMRAVSKVGFADRTVLRDTFLLTLAKTQDETKALGDCFDRFFDQPESITYTSLSFRYGLTDHLEVGVRGTTGATRAFALSGGGSAKKNA